MLVTRVGRLGCLSIAFLAHFYHCTWMIYSLSMVLANLGAIYTNSAEYLTSLQAEKIASRMICEDRMRGSIDQV